jgi:nucleotide-binding universal stress UspA family protein
MAVRLRIWNCRHPAFGRGVPTDGTAMKFKHILFPTDFSERSRVLTADVEYLANRCGSQVTLLHVFEIPATWYGTVEASLINTDCFNLFFDTAKRNLHDFQLNVPSARVERVLAEGDAAWQITEWSRDNDVDLIMMGTRGHGRFGGMVLGSVVSKVIHDARCMIWTETPCAGLPKEGASRISKVLCAIDLDSEALGLLTSADEFARFWKAEVQLIHTIPEAETRPNKYFDFDLHRYLMERARVEISKLQREAGTNFPISVQNCSLRKAVHEAATRDGANLILLGRGRSREAFGQLRSHIFELIHDATCPVLSCLPCSPSRTFSSYTAEHLVRSEAGELPLIGCQRP